MEFQNKDGLQIDKSLIKTHFLQKFVLINTSEEIKYYFMPEK